MNKIPLYSTNVNEAYKLYEDAKARAKSKNEFQHAALYGRARILRSKYSIDTHKNENLTNFSIYFYNRKNGKLTKRLDIVEGLCYDPNYNKTNKKKQVDIFNSAWALAYVMESKEHGVPILNWIHISEMCKVRLYMRVEDNEYGIIDQRYFYLCKTNIGGKWVWTGSKIEVKKRSPTEKRKLAKFLFSKKGVDVKSIALMLGYHNERGVVKTRQVQRYVEDLRKGKCNCVVEAK